MTKWMLKREQAKVKRELAHMRNRIEDMKRTYIELEQIAAAIRSGQAA